MDAIKCDRCGGLCEKGTRLDLTKIPFLIQLKLSKPKDLCERCASDFDKFMKNEEKEQKGKWILLTEYSPLNSRWLRCSVCGNIHTAFFAAKSPNRCDNCDARMERE